MPAPAASHPATSSGVGLRAAGSRGCGSGSGSWADGSGCGTGCASGVERLLPLLTFCSLPHASLAAGTLPQREVLLGGLAPMLAWPLASAAGSSAAAAGAAPTDTSSAGAVPSAAAAWSNVLQCATARPVCDSLCPCREASFSACTSCCACPVASLPCSKSAAGASAAGTSACRERLARLCAAVAVPSALRLVTGALGSSAPPAARGLRRAPLPASGSGSTTPCRDRS